MAKQDDLFFFLEALNVREGKKKVLFFFLFQTQHIYTRGA